MKSDRLKTILQLVKDRQAGCPRVVAGGCAGMIRELADRCPSCLIDAAVESLSATLPGEGPALELMQALLWSLGELGALLRAAKEAGTVEGVLIRRIRATAEGLATACEQYDLERFEALHTSAKS